MTSQPNIPYFEFGRFRYDQNDTVKVILKKNGASVNLAGRTFVFEFCKENSSEVLYELTDDKLTKENGAISFIPAKYKDDLEQEKYTIFLLEVLSNGDRDLIAWGLFFWLELPRKGLSSNQPRKPLDIVINEITQVIDPIEIDIAAEIGGNQNNALPANTPITLS